MAKNIFIIVFVILVILFIFNDAYIVEATAPSNTGTQNVNEFKNPLGNIDSPQLLIGNIINKVLGVVGSIALAMFVYGGFTWMLAGGNSEKVQKAKGILAWAALGLTAIFSAYAIISFVFNNFIS